MIDKDTFIKELNDVKNSIYGRAYHDITMNEINYFCLWFKKIKFYDVFQIPKKKKGEYRTITAPCARLKYIQRCINALLQQKFIPNDAANGFVKGKSIVDNANVHVGQRYIYNIDIKDFFPSVTDSRVFECLQKYPFYYNKETAAMIANLCCISGKLPYGIPMLIDGIGIVRCVQRIEGVHRIFDMLPQGAPTSPTLSNIVCNKLDGKLIKLAQNFDMRYSRYADDITFSSMRFLFYEDGKFISLLHEIIKEEGFTINKEKTRITNLFQRQEVTGVIVNEKTNVKQRYVKNIRTMLNNWEKGGYDYAQTEFLKHYRNGKSTTKITKIENVIKGKLNYLKMVKGADDQTYKRLNERYEKLIATNR